jgi:hypothetical protein
MVEVAGGVDKSRAGKVKKSYKLLISRRKMYYEGENLCTGSAASSGS